MNIQEIFFCIDLLWNVNFDEYYLRFFVRDEFNKTSNQFNDNVF